MSDSTPSFLEPAPTLRDDRRAALLAVLGLLITALYGRIYPDGLFHFDDLTHYLFARWSWQWPSYLLNEWGRPGFTALYALPARFGWDYCRAFSAILSAASAWFAYRIAQRAGLPAAWAVVPLCFIQPMFFALAQTTLTETALAFYLTLAGLLAQRGRWALSSAVLSLCFVTRHEAAVFLPVWVWFAWRQRIPLWCLWPIIWAPLLVNLLGPLAGLDPIWKRLLHHESSGQYGHGGWLTYFSRSLEAFGPAEAVLAILGIGALLRRPATGLVIACIAIYFTAQTAIRALGLYDSGGYARFLVGISPLVAIAALAGVHQILDIDPRRRAWAGVGIALAMGVLCLAMHQQIRLMNTRGDLLAEVPRLTEAVRAINWITIGIGAVAALGLIGFAVGANWFTRFVMPLTLAGIAAVTCRELCHPLWPPAEAPIVQDTLDWLRENTYADRPLISAVVWIDYKTDRQLAPFHPSVREQLEQAPIGAIFAWDRQFAACPDHDLPLEEFVDNPSFRQIHETAPLPSRPGEPYLILFEKIAPWGPGTKAARRKTFSTQCVPRDGFSNAQACAAISASRHASNDGAISSRERSSSVMVGMFKSSPQYEPNDPGVG